MSHKIIYSIVFILILGQNLYSQIDSHYWTNQYGAKGLLLNGAVIASADDETSIFYNPGCMGLADNLGFAFSFITPTYSSLKTKNFIGDENVISDTGLGFAPGFLAVRSRPFRTDKIVLGVTRFQRFRSDIKFEDRVTNTVTNSPISLFRGDLKFQQKMSEEWIGVGMAYNITKNLGIGFTQFSVWHSESLDFNFIKEIVFSNQPLIVGKSWRSEFDYDISIYSAFITKFGMNYRSKNFSLGMTFTTPMYGRLSSRANYAIDDQKINQVGISTTTKSNRQEVDLQEYKSPLSIGLGLEVLLKEKLRLSISSEYFSNTDPIVYFSETDDSFNGISTGDADVSINVQTQRQSVVNVAFGLQYLKSEKSTLLCGFRTDFNESSTLKINDTAEYLGSTPDVFHLSGGGTFKYGNNIFSIGIDLGYGGRSGAQQLADLNNITSESLFTFSGAENVNSTFYSAMLFITYDFIYKRFENPSKINDIENP